MMRSASVPITWSIVRSTIKQRRGIYIYPNRGNVNPDTGGRWHAAPGEEGTGKDRNHNTINCCSFADAFKNSSATAVHMTTHYVLRCIIINVMITMIVSSSKYCRCTCFTLQNSQCSNIFFHVHDSYPEYYLSMRDQCYRLCRSLSHTIHFQLNRACKDSMYGQGAC